MSWMDTLWDSVKQFFTEGFYAVWSGFLNMVDYIPETLANNSYIKRMFKTEDNWEFMLQQWVDMGLMDTETKDNLKSIKDFGSGMETILYFTVFMGLISSYIEEKMYAVSKDFRDKIYSEERPTRPNESVLATAAFIAPELTAEIRQTLANMGFSEDSIDRLFISMYRLYDEQTIQTLYLRGDIDKDTLYMRMRERGYTDTRTKEVVQSWEVIPPIQDLVRFAYRALFTPETREKWPWMFEAPGGFVDWTAKQGLSADWAELYWAAHWQQPGLRETFEMMHRGKINKDDVIYALEARGFSEYWQDKLLSISYRPYTRVDVRRMHDENILTSEELLRAYMDLGYDDERALNMANFTIKYNQDTSRDITRTQIENSYKDHLIGEEEARKLLSAIDYPEPEIDFLINFWEWEKQKGYEDRIIKNIGDRYKNNLIDSYEAQNQLGKLNLEGQRVNILLDEWEIDRYENQKLPSKSDLDKFFKNDIINRDDYYVEMRKLGYKTEYINWYVWLSDKKKG